MNRHGRWRLLAVALPVLLGAAACTDRPARDPAPREEGRAENGTEDRFRRERLAMVRETVEKRGVENPRVLEAMRNVERHRFVPAGWRDGAYADHPLPIGHEQTISQPYMVAFMTEAVRPRPGHKVLEVGTGSGYQAAVLAEIVDHVYTIEIVEELARAASERLERLGYDNVTVRAGDGYRGWPEHAPFDGIVVTAAPDHVPRPLVEQLAVGGIMVIPVGRRHGRQVLKRIHKTTSGTTEEILLSVRFVPMTGEAEDR